GRRQSAGRSQAGGGAQIRPYRRVGPAICRHCPANAARDEKVEEDRMGPCLSLLLFVCSANPVETKFVQLTPVPREAAPVAKPERHQRAVPLIRRFRPHPLDSKMALQAQWHSWQKADSGLVQALGKESDVFGFAYSQNDTVERIAEHETLKKGIAGLKQLGY